MILIHTKILFSLYNTLQPYVTSSNTAWRHLLQIITPLLSILPILAVPYVKSRCPVRGVHGSDFV